MDWKLRTHDAVIHDGYMWFSNDTFNGLFRMDINSGGIEFLAVFPGEKMMVYGLHKRCFRYSHFLIFLPAASKFIHIYDLEDGSFRTVLFYGEEKNREKIADAVLVNGKIYMFSWLPEDSLFSLDLEDFSLTRIDGFKKEAAKYKPKDVTYYLSRCSLHGDSKILYAILNTDMIAQWDIRSNTQTIFHTGIENLFSAHVIDDDAWITTYGSDEIYQYSLANSDIKKYHGLTGDNRCSRFYSRIVEFDHEIIAIPAFYDSVAHLENGSFVAVPGESWGLVNDSVSAFFSAIDVDKELWLLPFSADAIYVYEGDSKRIRRKSFCLENKEMKMGVLAKICREDVIYENQEFVLNDLIEGILYTGSELLLEKLC